MNNFEVGQKIVCINSFREAFPERPAVLYYIHPNGGKDKTWSAGVLREGETYTVRKVFTRNGYVSVCLNEIYRPIDISGHELGFFAERFRPLVEKEDLTKTGMEILKKILANPKIKIKEKV